MSANRRTGAVLSPAVPADSTSRWLGSSETAKLALSALVTVYGHRYVLRSGSVMAERLEEALLRIDSRSDPYQKAQASHTHFEPLVSRRVDTTASNELLSSTVSHDGDTQGSLRYRHCSTAFWVGQIFSLHGKNFRCCDPRGTQHRILKRVCLWYGSCSRRGRLEEPC
jgi:hypothetical protein